MITIELEGADPPHGRVRLSGDEFAFAGWLGLIRVLSDLIDRSG